MKLIAEKRQSIAFSKIKIAAQKIFEKITRDELLYELQTCCNNIIKCNHCVNIKYLVNITYIHMRLFYFNL